MSQCPVSALLPLVPLAFCYLLVKVLSCGITKHILMKIQNVARLEGLWYSLPVCSVTYAASQPDTTPCPASPSDSQIAFLRQRGVDETQ